MSATDTSTGVPNTPQTAGKSGRIRGWLQQMLAVGSLVVIVIFFAIASPVFLTFSNISNILLSTVVVGLLGIGVTFVIISSGIDLSTGTGMTLCAVMAGVFITDMGLPLLVGIIGAVLFGGLIGLVNGIAVSIMRIPPFIATLAMMLVAEGLALVISGSAPIYFNQSPTYYKISAGYLIPGFALPNAVWILFGLAIVAGLLLRKTVLGRYTYSIGSNEEATALSGINVKKWKIIVYVLGGLFTGVAGIMISTRLNSAQPSLGVGYELQAIAAAVIGGTSLSGGRGSVVGTVIGALIISVLNNGLEILSIPQEWQNVVLGAVILFAVYMDVLRKRGRA